MSEKSYTIHDDHFYFKNIGLNIAYYRKKRGYTQETLAEKVDISRSFLSAIEAPNVDKVFSLPVLFQICRILEVTPQDIFDYDK